VSSLGHLAEAQARKRDLQSRSRPGKSDSNHVTVLVKNAFIARIEHQGAPDFLRDKEREELHCYNYRDSKDRGVH